MGNKGKDKDKELHLKEGAVGSTCEARHATGDQSQERATAVEELVAYALARNTTELTARFMALLNESLSKHANSP